MNGQLNGQQRRSTGDAIPVNGSIGSQKRGGKWFFEDFDENED
jgi:hypothetical protein